MKKFSGKKLRKIRTAVGMSRFRLSAHIEFIVGPGTIQRYESGEGVPTLNAAVKIASALDVTLEDLLDA